MSGGRNSHNNPLSEDHEALAFGHSYRAMEWAGEASGSAQDAEGYAQHAANSAQHAANSAQHAANSARRASQGANHVRGNVYQTEGLLDKVKVDADNVSKASQDAGINASFIGGAAQTARSSARVSDAALKRIERNVERSDELLRDLQNRAAAGPSTPPKPPRGAPSGQGGHGGNNGPGRRPRAPNPPRQAQAGGKKGSWFSWGRN